MKITSNGLERWMSENMQNAVKRKDSFRYELNSTYVFCKLCFIYAFATTLRHIFSSKLERICKKLPHPKPKLWLFQFSWMF